MMKYSFFDKIIFNSASVQRQLMQALGLENSENYRMVVTICDYILWNG